MTEIIENIRKWLTAKLTFNKEEAAHIMEDVEEQIVIPKSYAQRFSLDPLSTSELIVSRSEELQMLTKAYDNWKISQNPVLFVGEAGTGMSSMLNHVKNQLFTNAEILKDDINIASHNELVKLLLTVLDTPEANNLNDIAKQLTGEAKIIIFENIERLFLRRIHGFNLLKDFLLFIHATKKNVFWIITLNKYSFYYLKRSIDIDANFLSIIQLKSFGAKEIEEVIQTRNEGYQLVFLKPEQMSRMFARKLNNTDKEGRQELLQKQFFKRLYDFSNGNISRSILFWLKSIVRIRDKSLYIKQYQPKSLENVSLDELLILEAILQHTSLSSKELELVLRQEQKGARLILELLMEKGLVNYRWYEGAERPEYQINMLYLKELKDLFRNRLNRNF